MGRFVHKTHVPLSLDNNRWQTLLTAYKMSATDVVEWLATAYRFDLLENQFHHVLLDDPLDDER